MLDSIDALNAALSSNETTGSDDTTESDETAEWGVYTYLKASVVGEHAEDESGWSVALSSDGQILAIGAMKNDDAGNNAGHVRVYQWDLANSEWLQRGVDIDGTSQGDGFGRSVALSADGSILAVGANGNDSFASNSGQTQVFKWDSGTWQQLGEDIYGEVAGDFSGFDVALSMTEKRLPLVRQRMEWLRMVLHECSAGMKGGLNGFKSEMILLVKGQVTNLE